MHQRFTLLALLGAALLAGPMVSRAGVCCPSDGHGAPQQVASQGLGESFPAANDLAVDPAWHVYEFERGGIRYMQVNDNGGVVHAIVGRIDGTFWVLPRGTDADRVSLPDESIPLPTGVAGRLIYGSSEVEVWLYQAADGNTWLIKPGT